MLNRSLISSWFLQFSINDHNQAFGGIDRLTFTDSSILSYSSFTFSAFNNIKTYHRAIPKDIQQIYYRKIQSKTCGSALNTTRLWWKGSPWSYHWILVPRCLQIISLNLPCKFRIFIHKTNAYNHVKLCLVAN